MTDDRSGRSLCILKIPSRACAAARIPMRDARSATQFPKSFKHSFHELVTSRLRYRHKMSRDRMPPKPIPITEILFEYLGDERSIECIYSRLTSGARCGGRIGQKETGQAFARRRALAVCYPNNTALRRLLSDYAEKCMCKRHRDLIRSDCQQFWTQQLDSWIRNIANMLGEDIDSVLEGLEIVEYGVTLDEIEKAVKELYCVPTRSSYLDTPGYFPSTRGMLIHRPDGMTGSRDAPEQFWLPDGSGHCNWQQVLALIEEKYKHRFDCLQSEEIGQGEGVCRATDLVTTQITEPDFTIYHHRHGNALISDIVEKSLGREERKEGWIYIYRPHPADVMLRCSHVKIGYTTKNTDKRLRTWSAKCGYEAEGIFSIKTSNAKRVELLIHKELEIRGTRRRDHHCRKAGGGCGNIHDEWFEIDEKEAIKVVRHWTEWMKFHNPYSAAGYFKPAMLTRMYDPVPNMIDITNSEDVREGCVSFVLDSCGNPWTSPETPWC